MCLLDGYVSVGDLFCLAESERWGSLMPSHRTAGVTTDAWNSCPWLSGVTSGKTPGLGVRDLTLNPQAFTSCVALGNSFDLSDPIFSHPEMTVLKSWLLCRIVADIKWKRMVGVKALVKPGRFLEFSTGSSQVNPVLFFCYLIFFSCVCFPSYCHHLLSK